MTRYESVALIVAAALIAGCFFSSLVSRDRSDSARIRAAVECRRNGYADNRLSAGYCYRVLERFSEADGTDMEIVLSDGTSSDSLICGSFDIIARSNCAIPDSGTVTIPVSDDSLAFLSIRTKDRALKKKMERWAVRYALSDEFIHDNTVFLRRFDPLKMAEMGGGTTFISPYDDIIKTYADTIGWNWKLLAAVIYQESQFRIEARSHKGAEGLMQMIPSTAEKWCDGDIIRPEEGIKAGAKYLGSLSRRYRRIAANDEEVLKFTLAAYNAGEGRIKDVINYAGFRNVNTAYWDSVITVIPEMRDKQTMAATDTVRLGAFNGYETINYVESVMKHYDAFNKIYIEQ